MPQFINSDNVQIPNQYVFNIVEKSKKDIYETVKMDNVVGEVVGVGEMIDFEMYSLLEKLLRVTCFVRRFILNSKAKVRGEKLLEGELSTLEIENSEVLWLKYEQRFLVNGESLEKMKHSLNLFYDEQSLLRSKSRHCELDKLDINRKLPVLLRSYSHFTKLIIMDSHEKVFHSGIISTLNFLSKKYWLIRGKQSIKFLLKNCVTCEYINGKSVIPPEMTSLPKSRVDYSYPYQDIGLEYTGPIYYKSADNSKRKLFFRLFFNYYVLLYTSSSYRIYS